MISLTTTAPLTQIRNMKPSSSSYCISCSKTVWRQCCCRRQPTNKINKTNAVRCCPEMIYRGKKPVYWSPSSRSALAEAELEYPEGYTSTAAFVRFAIDANGSSALHQLLSNAGIASGRVAAVIWTTTPWTIVANQVLSHHTQSTNAIVCERVSECVLVG
jgi:hypothetical protein